MQDTLSAQEQKYVIDFFKAHNLAWLGEDGNTNGGYFGDYLFNQWNVDSITPERLATAYKKLQEANRPFVYYTPTETQFHILEEQLGPQDSAAIRSFLPTYRLLDNMANFVEVANYCIQNSVPITPGHLLARIGNLQNSPRGKFLQWTPNPDQIRVQKETEERRKQLESTPRKEKNQDEGYNPYTNLPPELRAHRDTIHRPTEDIKLPEQTDTPNYWKGRCETAVQSVSSNLDRSEAQAIFDRNAGGNYQLTLINIQKFIERRKYERSVAGR